MLTETGDGMQNNDLKLQQGAFRVDIQKNFLTLRVVQYWKDCLGGGASILKVGQKVG